MFCLYHTEYFHNEDDRNKDSSNKDYFDGKTISMMIDNDNDNDD